MTTSLSSDDVVKVLRDTSTATAVALAELTGNDWACDLEEDAREALKGIALAVHRRIATRLGLTL